MALSLVVTDAGRAAIVSAGGGTAAVTITECGLSETAITAAPTDTALTGEFNRVTSISGAPTSPDTMHFNVQDVSVDDYELRSFALYLADGTLFALYGQPDPILVKTPPSILLMAVDIQFADIDATTITFGDTTLIDPLASDTDPGSVRLATSAETITGTAEDIAVTPKGLADKLNGIRHVVASSLIENGGYIKYSDGMIECWGYVDVALDSYGIFSLPTAHTSWVIPSLAAIDNPGEEHAADPIGVAGIIGAPPTAIQLWNGQNTARRMYLTTRGV